MTEEALDWMSTGMPGHDRESLLAVEGQVHAPVAPLRAHHAQADAGARGTTSGLCASVCGQIGVMTIAASAGWRIGPPAERL